MSSSRINEITLSGGGSFAAGWLLAAAATVLLCLLLVSAAPAKPAARQTPAQLLSEAKAELSASHAYKADTLLGDVIKSPDSSRAQVEEALVMRGMIYYGDVFGSALLLPSFVAVAKKPEPLGRKVSETLIMASRAFDANLTEYLNITAAGSKLQKVQLTLPDFSEADVQKLQDTLSNKNSVEALLAGYSSDPSSGEGLRTRASQFGMYLGYGGTLPKDKTRKLPEIKAKFAAGAPFDQARYLDWAASVCHDISQQVHDTQPEFNLAELGRRVDQRLLKVAPADSQFAKNAKARLEHKPKAK
jgi:hypothetical protein